MHKDEIIRKKLSKRLSYTKMQSKKHSYLGLVDELRQIRKNQMVIMEFLLANRILNEQTIGKRYKSTTIGRM